MIRVYNKNHDRWPLERRSEGASGYDLRADIGCEREIHPGERWMFGTGIWLAMPDGWEGQVRPRSGMARDFGLVAVLGTIDSDYRGEVSVIVMLHARPESYPVTVRPGDRIAQLVFAPVVHGIEHACSAEDLPPTMRGAQGFGSTGVR